MSPCLPSPHVSSSSVHSALERLGNHSVTVRILRKPREVPSPEELGAVMLLFACTPILRYRGLFASVERVPFLLNKEPLFVRLRIISVMILFQNCHTKKKNPPASLPASIFFLVYNILGFLLFCFLLVILHKSTSNSTETQWKVSKGIIQCT